MRLVPVALVVAAACGSQEAKSQHVITGSAGSAGDSGSGSGLGSAAPATTGPIALTATAHRGLLELTLTNTTAAPVTIASYVTGGQVPHYDWLTVTLTGTAGARTLHFIDARDESGTMTADVAPGAAHTASIDLVRWAIAGGNGDPLAPGSYQLAATWDTSSQTQGVKVVATASTTLVIEPPGPENCESATYQKPAGAKLMLLGHQASASEPVSGSGSDGKASTGRATVDAGLYNVGDVAVCVDSYIKTHELQYDWWSVLYADGAKYHHGSRVVRLDDARDKSYPVSVLLAPGQTIWHQFDVDAWARRARNGKEPLPAGSLYTQISYDTTHETTVWAGTLLSDSFALNVK